MRLQTGGARRRYMERSDMSRKLWLSIAALAIGAGLLVAAGVASPASSGNARWLFARPWEPRAQMSSGNC